MWKNYFTLLLLLLCSCASIDKKKDYNKAEVALNQKEFMVYGDTVLFQGRSDFCRGQLQIEIQLFTFNKPNSFIRVKGRVLERGISPDYPVYANILIGSVTNCKREKCNLIVQEQFRTDKDGEFMFFAKATAESYIIFTEISYTARAAQIKDIVMETR